MMVFKETIGVDRVSFSNDIYEDLWLFTAACIQKLKIVQSKGVIFIR